MKLKLTPETLEAMHDLARFNVAGRELPQQAALEAAGFVSSGRSRFGAWVRVTDLGRSYLSKTLSRGGRATSTRAPGDTGDSNNESAGSTPTVAPRPRPLRKRGEGAAHAGPEAALPPAAPAQAPNAIRIAVGKKFAYYPLGMFKVLKNGVAVVTQNPHYRQASLAASAADVEVPGWRPA